MSGLCEKSYAIDAKFNNFYNGGDVAWSNDGQIFYCSNHTEVCAVNVSTGQLVRSYGTNVEAGETGLSADKAPRSDDEQLEDEIPCFALAPDNTLLVTAHRSGLLRLWSIDTGKVVKLWKSQHRGPIVKIHFSNCGKIICSSGADSSLRIWDYVHSTCVCALREFSGPALVLAFHPDPTRTEVYAAGADNAIYCWNYAEKRLLRQMRGHLSQVTAITFIGGGNDGGYDFVASVSRDKVLIVWRLADASQHKVIPMYEELEGVVCLNENLVNKGAFDVVVACASGALKLVDCKTAKLITLSEDASQELRQLLYCKHTKQLAVVTVEQNILIYKATGESVETKTLECTKQLIGFNDEILDICFLGENDRFLAVASNSKNIKIYDTEANMNCKIVSGHNDTVMTLAAAGGTNLLLSAGKDLSILLWRVNPNNFTLSCIARNNSSHTSTIGCLVFGCNTAAFFASVSQDGSLKVWHLKKNKDAAHSFNLKYSALSHDKEVNSVSFSPNNKLLATSSQDKTAKLWSAETNTLVGTLRGHTRGVWCVRFSPADQVVLTSSSDCTLRLWSLSTLTCIKRFEQECTILRAEFIDYGKYIVSAATDGILKLWSIKTNECVQTLDAHTDRIWSLAVSARSGKCFYSGGADSKLIKWQDVTTQCRNEEIDKRAQLMREEQTLQSLLQQRQNMKKAFMLALRLGKPKTTYNIISEYVRGRNTEPVHEIINTLNGEQRVTLMEHTKAWTTNSRHCKIANLVLHYLLSDCIAAPTEHGVPGMRNVVEVLTPYLQRHHKRVNELTKELMFLEYIVDGI
ncbi:transducin beta-like protein 3 isoform X1 [Rhagoletis pomonella]|uniref:transducin beta-like protein 3 isoform X1 n=1 Tax=Rhagoletis pomonella TaxID=28610 RepID=UPI0017863335|nr:transducin beta-like protein 3 isoform X1 [Rhagoletis pomonella]